MNNKLAAVIVETRPLPNLVDVINQHMEMLPDYTQLYVFGSIVTEHMLMGNVPAFKFFDVPGVFNIPAYNKLLTSVDFWNKIEEENILIFQHDSMLLRKGIEEFYQWDYVGAPWMFQHLGGNGGLSFRKKSAILKCLIENKYKSENEDVFFSNCMTVFGHRSKSNYMIAPREVCERFSCETIPKMGTLGYHAIEKYIPEEVCEKIKNQYK